jgi:hypothetical protein
MNYLHVLCELACRYRGITLAHQRFISSIKGLGDRMSRTISGAKRNGFVSSVFAKSSRGGTFDGRRREGSSYQSSFAYERVRGEKERRLVIRHYGQVDSRVDRPGFVHTRVEGSGIIEGLIEEERDRKV